MGKPFGNGMPLAAVVTTEAIAKSFHNGLEYFNTFGGNPVCTAAGLAVLEVIKEEELQRHAKQVGEYLRNEFSKLAEIFPMIGQVRGSGLFIGIEFVRNRQTKEPATAETSAICSRMKDQHHILMSIDGPHNNVLVMKPPMCFSKEDAQHLMSCMANVLKNLVDVDPNAALTPT